MNARGRRIAAVDVGSNTVHLLVADCDDGAPVEVARTVVMAALGAAVHARGVLGGDLIATVAGVLRAMRDEARRRGAREYLAGATEAVRRAGDSDVALAAFGEALGAPCRLITAEAEARLAFRGALATRPGPGVVAVADIGGASTECAVGTAAGVDALRSLPIGSAVATARWLTADPPPDDDLRRCATAMTEILAGAPAAEPVRAVLTGGTATTMMALLGIPLADGATVDDVARCRDLLRGVPGHAIAERFSIDPARARVMPAGIELVAAFLSRYRLPRADVTLEGLRAGMMLAHLESAAWWATG